MQTFSNYDTIGTLSFKFTAILDLNNLHRRSYIEFNCTNAFPICDTGINWGKRNIWEKMM